MVQFNQLDLGQIMGNVQGIKSAQLQNQLGQQKLQANEMMMEKEAQFNPLLQNYLANPTPEAEQALFAADPQRGMEVIQQRHKLDQTKALQTFTIANAIVNTKGDPHALFKNGYPGAFEEFAGALLDQGIDVNELSGDQLREMGRTVMMQTRGLAGIDQQGGDVPASLQTFNGLTAGLSEEDKKRARMIELGLLPRASGADNSIQMIGGVPHIYDRISNTMVPVKVNGKEVDAGTVSESKAKIAGETERAKQNAQLTGKVIDESFATIGKINGSISTGRRAIAALEKGAKTGAVQQWLPNVTSASVELKNIQNQGALDIIGSVTFGALSKGELDLALETAIPTGMDEGPLKDFLERKIDAQEKLKEYLNNQIQFLNQGNTIADWLASQQEGEVRTTGVPIMNDSNNDLPEGFVYD